MLRFAIWKGDGVVKIVTSRTRALVRLVVCVCVCVHEDVDTERKRENHLTKNQKNKSPIFLKSQRTPDPKAPKNQQRNLSNN